MLNQVRRICLPVFVFLCSILMFSVNACAQVDRGAIVGTVSDSSSARIASAKITAKGKTLRLTLPARSITTATW